METYVIKNTDVVHEVSVDFVERNWMDPIHIVQYDKVQPIIAVSLLNDGKQYILPEGAGANIRFAKTNSGSVVKPALGCNSARNVVYFSIDNNMTECYGHARATVQMVINGTSAATSMLSFVIDRNPIQNN